jgi:hypothetical protein
MLGQFGQQFWAPMMQRLQAQRGQHHGMGQGQPMGGFRMPFGQAPQGGQGGPQMQLRPDMQRPMMAQGGMRPQMQPAPQAVPDAAMQAQRQAAMNQAYAQNQQSAGMNEAAMQNANNAAAQNELLQRQQRGM